MKRNDKGQFVPDGEIPAPENPPEPEKPAEENPTPEIQPDGGGSASETAPPPDEERAAGGAGWGKAALLALALAVPGGAVAGLGWLAWKSWRKKP